MANFMEHGAKMRSFCSKCGRTKEFDAINDCVVCPVCDVEWDPEVWDKVIMEKPSND